MSQQIIPFKQIIPGLTGFGDVLPPQHLTHLEGVAPRGGPHNEQGKALRVQL